MDFKKRVPFRARIDPGKGRSGLRLLSGNKEVIVVCSAGPVVQRQAGPNTFDRYRIPASRMGGCRYAVFLTGQPATNRDEISNSVVRQEPGPHHHESGSSNEPGLFNYLNPDSILLNANEPTSLFSRPRPPVRTPGYLPPEKFRGNHC